MLKPEDYFDLNNFAHNTIFHDVEFVWEPLKKLQDYIMENITPNVSMLAGHMLAGTCVLWNGEIIRDGFEIELNDVCKGGLKVTSGGAMLEGASVIYAGAMIFDEKVQIGNGSVVEPGALIKGPSIIGDNTEVRQGAYIRGNAITGNGCVVGHATEIKTAIMLDNAKAGHFAYIGDSILGNNVNLGAGTKLANLKIIPGDITLRHEGKFYKTGLRKLGAILGDNVEFGCNSVSSPGTVMGKSSLVLPCENVSGGIYPKKSLIHTKFSKKK